MAPGVARAAAVGNRSELEGMIWWMTALALVLAQVDLQQPGQAPEVREPPGVEELGQAVVEPGDPGISREQAEQAGVHPEDAAAAGVTPEEAAQAGLPPEQAAQAGVPGAPPAVPDDASPQALAEQLRALGEQVGQTQAQVETLQAELETQQQALEAMARAATQEQQARAESQQERPELIRTALEEIALVQQLVASGSSDVVPRVAAAVTALERARAGAAQWGTPRQAQLLEQAQNTVAQVPAYLQERNHLDAAILLTQSRGLAEQALQSMEALQRSPAEVE
jgi:hypothetical protein